ncbi:hypothetical protein PQR62_18565 [Herbaspirillum lusitanum]|jgi:hypothetical protein|uniref:Uncharacterized protein n=1 Tax=Herbaspirillum lusitanum TaxID=213312 RepID=A0ABW9AEF8_9BURK
MNKNLLSRISPRALMTRTAIAFALCTALAGQPAAAQSTASDASAISVVASVVAPAFFISEASEYVVKGVEASANGTVYVLEKIGSGVRGSVTVGANISGAMSVGVGEVIKLSTTAAGTLLISAGKVLAIIPNALGKSLMQSRKIS